MEPLTPPDCDLRDYPWTPILRSRLFGSSFHARATDAEWRAGMTLWLKAWEQVPAGSLPDDDIDLCRLAELGRDIRAWRKVKARALHGWAKASDGRLYHHVVAEVVLEAWDRRTTAIAKGVAGASKRWASRKPRDGPTTPGNGSGNPPSKPPDGSGNAPAVASEVRSGSGSISISDVQNPHGDARASDSHVATEKSASSKAKVEPWWKTIAGVNATAKTLGIPRRIGESDMDFRDRVYAAVQEKQRKDEADAQRRASG